MASITLKKAAELFKQGGVAVEADINLYCRSIEFSCDNPVCDGFKKNGICTTCGFGVECGWCKKIKQPSGNYEKIVHESEELSSGICPECLEKEKKSAGE